ncbi:MAG: NAD(+)/NADH kinase [Nitrososphaerota archaeon]|nr:NAD(+)/NADH kinase [Nitrososphaerota archaeon]
MKAKMFLDGGAPKLPPKVLRKVIQEAGIAVTEGKADFGIVLGGDGRFSRYGRTETIPLLFVGVRSKDATGSRAFLAEATFDELPQALERIRKGDYSVKEHPRLLVLKNGRSLGEVFTDAYLQRGSESACLRYNVRISGGADIEEAAIGDGVIVSTKAGSTGYYSYPDRIKGDWMDPSASAVMGIDEMGICHVNPTYTERKGADRHPLRYEVPWGCSVELSLFREADARIYGTTDGREGVKVSLGDRIRVRPGKSVTRVLTLR